MGEESSYEIDVYEKGNQPLYPFLMFFLKVLPIASQESSMYHLRFSTRPLAGLIEFAIFSMHLLL